MNAKKIVNQRFKISPATVTFPTNAQQVAAAVMAGAAQNMEVARSGGHSYIANGLGGNNGSLVVDWSKMKAITVVKSNNTAVIETGNRLGDIALALNAAGRAIPHGTCPYVGIGGHSGYGGFGYTSRAWGLTLDTIKSATVVLANGTVALPTLHRPLPITGAFNAIASLQTFAASNIPAELGAGLVVLRLRQQIQRHSRAVTVKTLPKPSWSTISPGSYINSVSVLAGQNLNTSTAPDGNDTFYTKSLMTPSAAPMSAAAIKAFVTYMAVQGVASDTDWFVEVDLYGGNNSAINAVPLDSTAFAKRDTLFTIQMYASSSNAAPPYPADGFTFVDGVAASILSNSPAGWNYGAYLTTPTTGSVRTPRRFTTAPTIPVKVLKASLDPLDTFRFPIGV
ncbi:glucooligosaccharide oxidase [Mycena polygramma]|nr:glucooligosaccharide oxidase [Mycena polygramma]